MKTSNFTVYVTAFAGLVASALIAGCQPPIAHGEKFYDNGATSCSSRFVTAQTAAGAKEDGMLYDRNFHGSQLNSLGYTKLDLILKGTPTGDQVYVYLSMPHDQVAVRQAAVTAYLKSAGVTENKIIVAEGPNPNPGTPTAYNMSGVYKHDGANYNGEAAVDSAPPGAGMTSGGTH